MRLSPACCCFAFCRPAGSRTKSSLGEAAAAAAEEEEEEDEDEDEEEEEEEEEAIGSASHLKGLLTTRISCTFSTWRLVQVSSPHSTQLWQRDAPRRALGSGGCRGARGACCPT